MGFDRLHWHFPHQFQVNSAQEEDHTRSTRELDQPHFHLHRSIDFHYGRCLFIVPQLGFALQIRCLRTHWNLRHKG